MRLFRIIAGGLRTLFRKQQVERDLEEELRCYFESAVEQKMQAGMCREDAAREARMEMGSTEAVKDEVRDLGWESALDIFLQDVRYGLRILRKSPAFTGVAVLVLALGIGANTAMFSVIEAVLLRSLPYRDANRMVRVASTRSRSVLSTTYSSSPPDFFDWRDQNRTFSSMFAYYGGGYALTGHGESKRVRAILATAGMFSTLQVHPMMGREFAAEENRKGADHVVILSHGFWQAEFGGTPDVIGRTIELDSEPYTIIGLMPAEFRFPLSGSDTYIPIGFDDKVMTQRGAHYLAVLGRLKAGFSVAQANDDLSRIMTQLRKLYPDTDGKWGVRADRWTDALVGDVRASLLLLLGAVGLVALIACANVSNLLLARATVRHRELAMRSALGARRSRLVRQMLTEGLLLALLAGTASLLLVHWALVSIVRFGPKDIPRLASTRLDGAVLGFTMGVSVVSAMLFGLIPALQSSSPELSSWLKTSAASASSTRHAGRLRGALLIGEVALSLMLLAGSGLLIRSFVRLRALSPGFEASGTITTDVSVPDARYKNSLALQNYWDQLLEKLRGLPNVTSVGAVTPLPFSGADFSSSFRVEGKSVPENDEPSAELRVASPDYFRTMAIPLRQGRRFMESDRLGTARVLLISETAVRMFFPAGDAIGQRITFGARGGHEKNEGEIVGIVGDVHDFGLDSPVAPTFYVPLAQAGVDGTTVVMHTPGMPASLAHTAPKLVRSIDPDVLVGEAAPLEDLVSGSLGQRRFYMMLLGTFAALALLLGAVGLYGVVSYSVAQRTQEIGIRVALGATRTQVLAMVMWQGLRLAGVGLAIGLVLALTLNRALKGLLVGVSTTDPPTLVVTTIVLFVVGALACYFPARRAARVDPMVALRLE